MISVLFVINSLAMGGAEKLLYDSIPKYVQFGLNVKVLIFHGEQFELVKKLKKVKGCTIYSLNSPSVYNPFLIFKISKFLKNVDLVHVHLFPALYMVAMARIGSNTKARFIYTEHSTTNRRRTFYFKWIDRYIYRKYDRIVTITEEVKESLKEHLNFNSSRFTIIQNGVDLLQIQKASKSTTSFFSEDRDAKIIMQVSRFHHPKDQATVVRSLLELPDKVKLILVGEGIEQAKVKSLVLALNLQDRVLFLGLRTDVPELLKAADIVVLSSHYEGLSLSSLEAMASGRPFVASKVPGLTNLVEGAGVLFEHQDHLDLAEKINHLLEDPEYYNQVAAACLERSEKYSLDQMVNAHIQLYNELCPNQN